MASELRCPKCNAKLRFDEPPKAGEEIDCPRCETAFRAPPPPITLEKKDEPKKEAKKPKALVTKERVHFSSIILLLIVGSLMAILIGTLMTWWFFLYKAGKAEDMLATVPDNFNVIRGVNAKAMENYPKVQPEADKFYDEEAKGIYSDACKAVGLDPATSLAYFIAAREARPGGGGSGPTLLLFLTKKSFDPSSLGDGSIKLMPGNRVQGKVACPNNRLIAVAFNGSEDATLNGVLNNANKRPKDGMHTKVGTIGLMAVRGHIWTIIRPVGTLSSYLTTDAEQIKEDGSLTTLRQSFASAKVLATWTSFGSGGVRFGAGLSLADSKEAKALVKDMKSGPLGQGDESEPPNGIKKTFSFLTQHKEFLQYLEYRSSGESAYIISKIADPEKARAALSAFNSSSRAAGNAGGMGTRF